MLGTRLMAALIERELLTGGDGIFQAGEADHDRLSAAGLDLDYRLTRRGIDELSEFGIDLDALPRRRALIRYCVDWSEQHHHLAGALGAAVADRMFELDWCRRIPRSRALQLTDAGRAGLDETFGVELDRALISP